MIGRGFVPVGRYIICANIISTRHGQLQQLLGTAAGRNMIRCSVVTVAINTTQRHPAVHLIAVVPRVCYVFYSQCQIQWRREAGAKGASAPGGTVQGAAFRGAKIWNSEIWPLLANWLLHCIAGRIQRVR